jgi:hypothetical protein
LRTVAGDGEARGKRQLGAHHPNGMFLTACIPSAPCAA